MSNERAREASKINDHDDGICVTHTGATANLPGITDSDEAGSGNSSLTAQAPFHSVGFNLSSLGYAVARRFRETLAPLDLPPREFALLRAVAASEGQSQQAIGERLLIPASRMVAFVDALQARGLLERRPNPDDRRARALHLTRKGHELLAQAFSLASEFERRICADLSEAERDRLIGMLQRIGARLGLPSTAHAAHAALDESAQDCPSD